jgi:hypothetical protein
MKQEQDKELDLLLRQHAKRESSRTRIGVSVDKGNDERAITISEHLDADAMNAYAENVLPASTRVRYAAHLVACDACRKVVTQLALAANPIRVEKKEDAIVPSVASSQTWREWFLSLFTLHNLKIAGPVAAVLCVAAVTFIAWQRQDELPSTVSPTREVRDEGISPTFPKFGGEDKTKSTNANVADSAKPTNSQSQNTSSSRGATTDSVSEETKSESAKSGETERSDSPKKDAATAPPVAEKKGEPKEADREKSQVAISKPSPTQPPSGPMANQQNQTNQAQTNVAGQTQAQPQPATAAKSGEPNRSNRDAGERSRQNTNEEQTASRTDANAAKSENKPAGKKEKNAKTAGERKQDDADDSKTSVAKKKAEPLSTRTVGGKQFYRQGNMWIDKAYNGSSRTDIKRGSDEYNSLESGLRSIAEQLGGEVIVVWKNKAYRIY